MTHPFRLLLIGDSDSQLLACEALCRFPEDLAVEVTINAIPRNGTPEPILRRAENLGRLWRLEMGQLLMHPDLMQFDAIGVFLTGSKISDVRLALGLLPAGERPLLFCGFNGVVLEKFMEGMCWRLGYDLICLNGLRDREALERMVFTTPFRRQRTVITGLQRSNALASPPDRADRSRQLVFAEQVVMPATPRDRAEMVRILAELARRSPNWDVLIKPRIAPDEATFHACDSHISRTLMQTLGHPPANLRLDYRPLPELLKRSRLMATISSTAFFDALDHGCRPVVMADFGITPSSGSHVFAGSGVWRSLADVEDLDVLDAELHLPDPAWLQWMGYGTGAGPTDLIQTLRELKQNPPESLHETGGHISNANLSFTQLRRGAEEAIRVRNWEEASSLLMLANLMRPQHRNVARRLRAVQAPNQLLRRLLVAITHRDVG